MNKLLLLLIFLFPSIVFSQSLKEEKYKVKLKSGAFVPETTSSTGQGISNSSNLRTEAYSGSYKMVQFFEIPNQEEQRKIRVAGIELLEYVPNNAYLAYFSIDPAIINTRNLNIRSIHEILPTEKIDPLLKQEKLPEWVTKDGGKLGLVVKYFKRKSAATVRQKLNELGCEITKEFDEYNQFEILANKDNLDTLASLQEVSYILPVAPPAKVFESQGLPSHNINVLNSNVLNGRNLNGEGIVIGIGDGGYLDFHHDYQKRVSNGDKSYSSAGYHSIHVAGIIGGVGNLSPEVKGGAFKSKLINYSFYNIILNAPSLYTSDKMVITNNSYGFEYYYGVYDYYSSLVDRQVQEYPKLLHLFAAGNEYGINTVSGAFNSAKNVLTVGSIESEDVLAEYSSKGPVADGRIKPEIVATGSNIISLNQEFGYSLMSGTSMATPVVSSLAALLYQRYQQLHKVMPNSDLIKAVLCNSSQDLGSAGPDYFYGFGKVNARRAVETLEEKRYFIDSVKQSSRKEFTINVPEGSNKVKVMLYWHDQEGSNVSSVSLVNDLDLEILSGTTKFLPLVLNPYEPELPATPAKDRINNIEQVTVDLPKSGKYTVRVTGFNVPFTGSQKFVVTYEIVKPELILTHPFGGESFAPGDQIEVKWDNYTGKNVDLQYSMDNGKTWKNLALKYPSKNSAYLWNVPDVLGQGILRVKTGDFISQSKQFNIIGTPENVNSTLSGAQTIRLSWSKVKGATSYDVFLLNPDAEEFKLAGTTSGNSYSFDNLTKSASYLFTVRAKTATVTGKRAFAARMQLNDPVVKITNPTSSQKFKGCDLIKVKAEVIATPSKSKMEILLDGNSIYQDWEAPYETFISYSPGSYHVEINITNEYGAKATTSKTIDILPPATTKLPYTLNFEENSGKWTSREPEGENIWKWGYPEGKTLKTASSGKKAWYTMIPKNAKPMKEYSLITPAFNLRDEQGPIVFSFKQNLAIDSKAEGVFIEYSLNCGMSWMNLGSRTSNGLNWYDSKLTHWNGEYFSNKDAWTNTKSGWRDVKLVVPQEDFAESDVQFKITYYMQEDSKNISEGIAIDDFKIERFINKSVIKKDSLALVAIYNSLKGKTWNENYNWLKTPVNEWYGIQTFDGRVTGIDLWNNNLNGKLPKEIGNLDELKKLAVSYNEIKGSIPSTIGNLKKLTLLDLDKNQVEGNIPPQLGNCKNLYLLFLSTNNLEGKIPKEIGNLENLEWAFLDFNKLTGSIPSTLKNCSNLEWFNINYNRISNIPDLKDAKRVFELNAQKNKLTFEHIEPNILFFPYSYLYEEQDSVGKPQTHEPDPGTSFVLSANFSGNSPNNRYEWFKNGKSISKELTSPFFELKNLSAGFSAEYFCAITNTKVEGLTLYTHPIKIKVKSPKVIYRLNVGGSTLIKGSPVDWKIDSRTNPSPHLEFSPSSRIHSDNVWNNKVNNTGAPNTIFTSFRTDSGPGGLKFKIPLKNGNYLVSLFFAEVPKASGVHKTGEHLQDIYIENQKVLAGFDMYGQNKYNAIKKYFNVWVIDGNLNINIKGVKGSALINGIELALISEMKPETLTTNPFSSDLLKGLILNVFPNPVKNNSFTVTSGSFSGKNVNLKIYDRFFSLRFEQNIKADSNGVIPVNISSSNLAQGVYFVKITDRESGTIKLARFIKE